MPCDQRADLVCTEDALCATAAPCLFVQLVVRGFLGDEHVVDVAFTKGGIGDLDEVGLVLQFFDGADAAVTHSCAEPADKLGDH